LLIDGHVTVQLLYGGLFPVAIVHQKISGILLSLNSIGGRNPRRFIRWA